MTKVNICCRARPTIGIGLAMICFLAVHLAITQSLSAADDLKSHQDSKSSRAIKASDASEFTQPVLELSTLSDTDFSLRRRSTIELWQNRDLYRDAVVEATRSADLETAERARWVLERWRRGIFANTPPETAKQLSQLPPGEAIELLLETASFDSATIAMQEAVGTLDFDAIANRVAITLDERFPVYAHHALERGVEKELLDFLDVAMTTKELAVCRHDWANLIGATTDTEVLASRMQAWPQSLAAQTQCLLYLLDGDGDAAMRIAVQMDQKTIAGVADQGQSSPNRRGESERPLLLSRIVRMVRSQWAELAMESAQTAEAIESAGAVEPGQSDLKRRGDAIRWWSDTLIGASRCDDLAMQEKAVEGLRMRTPPPAEDSSSSSDVALPDAVKELAWRTLLIHGYIDEAIRWVAQEDRGDAAMIASAASRSLDAIELLGYDLDEIDERLLDQIDEAIEAQRELFADITSSDSQKVRQAVQRSASGIAPEIESLFGLMRFFLTVGRDDAAWKIADRLSLEDLSCKRGGGASVNLIRDYVLLTLMLTNQTDWIIRLGFREWEMEPSLVSQSLIARIAIVDDYQVLMILSDLVRMHRPQMPTREAFQTACEIARGDAKDRQRHAPWIPILAQSLRDGSLRKKVNQDTQLDAFFQPHNRIWSDLFVAYGRPDLAEPLIRRRASTGDLEAIYLLAKDYRLTSSVTDESLDESFERIWEAVAKPHRDADSRFNENVTTGIDALVGQARLAMDRGDAKIADQVIRDLSAMACTPSTVMRQHIADALADLGQWDRAESIYRSLLWMIALSSDESESLIDTARRFQSFALRATRRDLERTESAVQTNLNKSIDHVVSTDQRLRRDAVDWFDLAFAGTLDKFEYRPQLYLIYPRLIARERLEIDLDDRLASDAGLVRNAAGLNSAGPDVSATVSDASIVKQVKHLERLDRMDITTAESILPTLRRVHLNELADQFIESILDESEEHLRIFPADAMVANNVAWAAAMNDYDLDRALEMSRRAVTLEPDSAIYRDTLAEILARLDRPTEAWQIEQGCVLDDPSQWHLHEQIQRFQKLAKQR